MRPVPTERTAKTYAISKVFFDSFQLFDGQYLAKMTKDIVGISEVENAKHQTVKKDRYKSIEKDLRSFLSLQHIVENTV